MAIGACSREEPQPKFQPPTMMSPGFTEETKEKMEWWNNDEIINAKDRKTGDALIEIRQGLVDRSKSPFYLVNNADYETIQ